MKKRPLLLLLPIFVFLNSSFFTGPTAGTIYYWVGNGSPSNQWNVGMNWQDQDGNAALGPPGMNDDVIIDGNFNVILSSSPQTVIVESVFLKNGADLTINNGATLNTERGNSENDGFSLDPNCSLTVNGILNINTGGFFAPDAGLNIDPDATVTIGSTGSLNIANAQTDGINAKGFLINNGTISITNSASDAIYTHQPAMATLGLITNINKIIITGGAMGINIGSVPLDNYGTVIISGTSGDILYGGGNFRNFGTFGGNGTVAPTPFKPQNTGFISPGTAVVFGNPPSIGALTFTGNLNLKNVTLNIEIEGATSYDQIIVEEKDALNVDQATLNLSGSYTPVSGDMFNVLTSANMLTSILGAPFVLNGVSMDVSFAMSTGMMTVSFGSVLPVELIDFTARAAGKAVQLDWSTATETNNDYFSVEYAADGRHFSEIGRLSGAGASREARHYTFKHHSPEKGMNYYRLNQRDFDGASAYSKVQAVFLEKDNGWTIRPALARDVINVEWGEALKRSAAVAVFNLAGQKVYSQEVLAGAADVEIPVTNLVPGMYWVLVQENGEVATQRFVKE
ncbi:MAG: T9SS type A sorting domain-containing protein [Lewinellaceae bacterium]|nr:T9SS type A sorting domain-containing protein [Lewinellaceae bacterium]